MNREHWIGMFRSWEGFAFWSGIGLMGRPVWVFGVLQRDWNESDTGAVIFGAVLALSIWIANRALPGEKVNLL